MKKQLIITGMMLALAPAFFVGCKNGEKKEGGEAPKSEAAKAASLDKAITENREKVDKLNQTYPRMPTEGKLLEKGPDAPVYKELVARYKTQMTELKKDIESSGAKMVAVLLTVHLNEKSDLSEKYGNPIVKATCNELGIEFFDFGPLLASHDQKEIKQIPKDAHWTKVGSKLIADNIAPYIKKFPDAACKVTFKDNERPETFGDLPPNDDEVLDGGKDMPYHVKANSQGVRMDHDLTFPKKKKRVVLIGDSGFFCPFLDNENTIAYLLQQQFPEYEIFTVAGLSWTLTDFISLWNEKIKFTEPDIVIVGTNATDIEDLFFSHMNHFIRDGKPTYPSPVEEKYYHETYN